MNKFYSFLATAALALSFTACEDVPAPYGIFDEDYEGTNPTPGTDDVIFEASFATDFGGFNNFTTSGEGAWKIDFKTAKATGYDFDTKKNTAGVYYLVSPELSLEAQTEAHLTFEYIQAYASRNPQGNKVMISTTFDANKADQNWTELPVTFKEPNTYTDESGKNKIDWKTFHNMDIQIPAEYMGKKIYIAFYHACDDKGSTTMEIKNVKLLKGKAAGGEEVNPNPNVDDVKNLPYTEDFSTSFGSFKNYTTSGAGEWIIDFKTAKASGYVNKQNIAGVYYLVSPEISLAGQTEAHVSYEYIQAYSNNFADGDKVMISTTFNAEQADQNWTELPVAFKEPNMTAEGKVDWKSFHNMDIQIPAEYMGKNVRIAFYHACDEKGSTTMEIKNLKVEAGKAAGGGEQVNPEGNTKKLPYAEAFSSTLGGFKSYTANGQGEWGIDFGTAKMSNHIGGKDGYDVAGTVLLVSPEVTLEGQSEAHIAYEYILRYDKGQENQQVLINTAFDEANPDNGWKLLNGTHTEGTDWTTFAKADFAVPAEYMGQKIRIAFRYVSTETGSSTWEVKNFSIEAGKPGESVNPQPGEGDTGDINALNGDFECWVGGLPNNWNGAAGSARLHQSTDAHSGKYSVKVEGYDKGNKRLSYKDLDLKAGSYTIKAFMKSEAGATARFGYSTVPAASGNDYHYGDYINNIPNTWTEYTYTFEIPSDGKYNILIMNGKKPGKDILVDDVTVTAADGTVIIK